MFGKNKNITKTPNRYYAVLLRTENNVPVQLEEKEVSLTDTKIKFESDKDATYVIPQGYHISVKKANANYMYFSMDNKGAILTWNRNEYPIDVKSLDVLITQNIVVGFLKLFKQSFDKTALGSKLAGYIVCLALGGAVGYIISTSIKAVFLVI